MARATRNIIVDDCTKELAPRTGGRSKTAQLTNIEIQQTCAGHLERLCEGEHERLMSNLRGLEDTRKVQKSNVSNHACGE